MLGLSLTPSFQQIPYNTVLERVESGTQGLQELTNFLVERKELEEKAIVFSSKVSRSNLYEYEIPNSTGEKVLGFFKNYFLFLSKAQVKYHKGLGENIVKELEELKVLRTSGITKHKLIVQNSLREVTNAEDALDKAKKNYMKAKLDFEKAKEKLALLEQNVVDHQRMLEEKRREQLANGGKEKKDSKWKMFSSAFEADHEGKRDDQFKRVGRRHNELVLCMGQIIEKKNALVDRISNMDAALERATHAFQETETERTLRLKSVIKQFCSIERAALEARGELLDTLEEAVRAHDPAADLELFITQSKQVELTHKYTNALELMDVLHKQMELEKEPDVEVNGGRTADLGDNATVGNRKRNSSTQDAFKSKSAHGRDIMDISNNSGHGGGVAGGGGVEVGASSALLNTSTISAEDADDLFVRRSRENITVSVNKDGEIEVRGADGRLITEDDDLFPSDMASSTAAATAAASAKAADSADLSSTGIPIAISNVTAAAPVTSNASSSSPWDLAAAAASTPASATATSVLPPVGGGDSFVESSASVGNEDSEDGTMTPGSKNILQELSINGMNVASSEELRVLTKMSAELSLLFPAPTSTTSKGGKKDRAPSVDENDEETASASNSMSLGRHSAHTPPQQQHAEDALMTATASMGLPASSTSPSSLTRQGTLYFTAEQEDLVENWATLLSLHEARELFLQELDEKRGAYALLPPKAYDSMACAMKAFLDHCDAFDDVKSAMRITNMANTFHKFVDVIASTDETTAATTAATATTTSTTGEGEKGAENGAVARSSTTVENSSTTPNPKIAEQQKVYIQSEPSITKHIIWRKPGFWESSLQEGVITQMKLTSQQEEQPLWDELAPDALREAVIGVHNIVFGQLVALAFTMHDVGLSFGTVMTNVISMSRRAQLTEDQEQDLVRNVRSLFGKSAEMSPEEVQEMHAESASAFAARLYANVDRSPVPSSKAGGSSSSSAAEGGGGGGGSRRSASIDSSEATKTGKATLTQRRHSNNNDSSLSTAAKENGSTTVANADVDEDDDEDDDDTPRKGTTTSSSTREKDRRESLFGADFDYIDDEADRLLSGASSTSATRQKKSGYGNSSSTSEPEVATLMAGYAGDTAPVPVGAIAVNGGSSGGCSASADSPAVFSGHNSNSGAKVTLTLPGSGNGSGKAVDSVESSSSSTTRATTIGSSGNGKKPSAVSTVSAPQTHIIVGPTVSAGASDAGAGVAPTPVTGTTSSSSGENGFLKFFSRSSSSSTPAKASGAAGSGSNSGISARKKPAYSSNDDFHTL